MKQAIQLANQIINMLADIRNELTAIRQVLNEMRTQQDRTDIR